MLNIDPDVYFDRTPHEPLLQYLDALVISLKLENKDITYDLKLCWNNKHYLLNIDFKINKLASPSTRFLVLLPIDQNETYEFRLRINDRWVLNGRKIRQALLKHNFKNYKKEYRKSLNSHYYRIMFSEPSDILKLVDIFKKQLPI